MIPEWMSSSDTYAPPKEGGAFYIKTIKSIGNIMSRLRIQRGHEKKYALPAIVKFVMVVCGILLLSINHTRMVMLLFATILQAYLCTWPSRDIWNIIKAAGMAGIIAFILFLPAMILTPENIPNNLAVVIKVFICMEMLSIFNHTTQWNHITGALKKLHIPAIFIFTLDITLKYIVLLGTLITDLLTSLQLRSVGKNNKKYQSVGGVMGITFIRGAEMSGEMYEAMCCRGFTDDYDRRLM
jgi:cobalt/nickel transport system permease protein